MRRSELSACAVLTAALVVACGAPPQAGKSAAQAPEPKAATELARAEAPAVDSVPSSAPAPLQTDALVPKVEFPPPDFAPPFPRSAKPGDGKWVALGDSSAGDFAGAEPHLLFSTVVHPHEVSRFISVSVIAVDLTRAALELVPGTEDPEAPQVPASERTGLIPAEHHASALAVFNGGYQTPHGRWGVMVEPNVFVPPRLEGCTLALYRDGSARIATWPALAATQKDMLAFRQTPPCLVEQAELHPDLKAWRERAWGGRVPNVKTRNRSAVGVDRTGRVLFYGYGDEAGAALLGEGMRMAGAHAAAQLDINYYWTRFLLIGKKKPAAPLQITSSLAPKMQYQKRGYVAVAEKRDFFYVRRR
ncbi:MAG TPA: hypothetical protein VK524_28885 [Polyangiaceae bacterium]|nr:hypothetical protein [Polyangiaceae bacterium]